MQVQSRPLLIGELAQRTGVNIETIRYYERVGLLSPPSRTPGRHRAYEKQHIEQLTFVRRSRELGFPLDDIRALLELGPGERPNRSAKEIALRHLGDVRGKIASLRKLERALTQMTDRCQASTGPSCPIMKALSTNDSARIGVDHPISVRGERVSTRLRRPSKPVRP